ncbi:hypothetical protein B0T17DRAFT_531224 [Bombardia bombarda]|uniref:Uncharacterized protein n=1 Tax=Bombardia bombarda TaxID=252184 RepID=A0AA39X049_9PEZI|nr:hypothetical protein B0T17DRAFT_531224 [Bombardia bombarda]
MTCRYASEAKHVSGAIQSIGLGLLVVLTNFVVRSQTYAAIDSPRRHAQCCLFSSRQLPLWCCWPSLGWWTAATLSSQVVYRPRGLLPSPSRTTTLCSTTQTSTRLPDETTRICSILRSRRQDSTAVLSATSVSAPASQPTMSS